MLEGPATVSHKEKDAEIDFEDSDRAFKRRRLSNSEFEEEYNEDNDVPVTKPFREVPSRIKPRKTNVQSPNNNKVHLTETEISNGKVVDAKSSFATVNVTPWLLVNLGGMSILRPTAIQKSCIPEILGGRDVIGVSQTGSGKTVAFAVPIIQRWAVDPSGIFAVVLTATR
jgi:ATP-dependent RNA helicase DDX49/DBP8